MFSFDLRGLACLLASSQLLSAARSLETAGDSNYSVFAGLMSKWGYEWEAIKVPTEDGFILTTFHVTGKTGETVKKDDDLMPVVFMHGLSADATTWF